jgi:hypothetical protein
MFAGFGLPFGKRYAEAGQLIQNGMQQYHQDVLNVNSPVPKTASQSMPSCCAASSPKRENSNYWRWRNGVSAGIIPDTTPRCLVG